MALESRLNCGWLNIRKAISKSASKISYLQAALFADGQQSLSPGASFVCFGSLARAEWTFQSDLDWIMLISGGSEEQHAIALQTLTARLDETKEIGPALGGMFGSTVLVANLTASIRRPSSVRDLSVRLLLLLESIAVGDGNPRREAIHEILAAYLTNPYQHPDQAENISDLLLNDLASFGEIMAVDFEQVRQEQEGQKWGLRNAKRRFSRKLIIATGSLACLRWKLQCAELPPHGRPAAHNAIEYFEGYLVRPPLEILAAEVVQAKIPNSVARRMFDTYDQFLGILDDADSREHLARLPQHLANTSSLFRQVQAIGEEFGRELYHLLNLARVARC
jgi:hypothetical protein